MAIAPKMSFTVIIVALVAEIVLIGVGGFYYQSNIAPTPSFNITAPAFGITPAPPGKAAVPNPDTFVMMSIGEPDFLDPAVDYETAGGEVLQNVYETLVWYNGSSTTELIPMLATEWSVSADGLEYTFKLRQGVKFHDGTDMTADDVIYSLRRAILINDHDGPAWIISQVIKGAPAILYGTPYDVYQNENADEVNYMVTQFDNNQSLVKIDDYTVKIVLEFPYPAFLQTMAYTVGAIVSKDAVEANGGVRAGFHNDWMDEHTAGTGPFKLKEWVRQQRIVLERNDNYWQTPAKLKTVIIAKVDDVSARELALFAGDADAVYIPAANALDVWDPATKASKLPTIKVYSGNPTFTIEPFLINLKFGQGYTLANASSSPYPPMAVREFRYALSYSFDYDTFINSVLNGIGKPGRGPIPEGMFGFSPPDPWPFTYNPTKAKELFQLVGWTGTVDLFYNAGNEGRRRASLLLKSSIEGMGVGITVNVQELDWPTFLAKIRKRDLPIFFVGWAPDYADPDDYVIPFVHGELGVFAFRVGYNNDTVNDWIEAAARELDLTKRASYYKNITQAIVDAAVYIWVNQAVTFGGGGSPVQRDWVKGYYYNPMYSNLYYYALSKEY